MFPGPATTSTRGIDSVPYAIAAIACAPPARYTVSTWAIAAAARIASGTVPSRRGGVASTTSSTPATRAGMAVISTVDGYGARPPGAYTPARRTGRVRMLSPPEPRNSGSNCREWKSRMRWAANSSAARSAASRRSAARASSAFETSNVSPSRGAHPSKRRPSSRSAASPSSATRAQISATAAFSDASRAGRDRPATTSAKDAASYLSTGMRHRRSKPCHDRLQRLAPRLQADLVRDQTRGRFAQHARDAQAVLAQGATGGGQIDDGVDEPNLGGELDRAVEPDDLDRLAAGLEPRCRRARVLGRDSKERRPRLRPIDRRRGRHREHEPAGAEAQVDELVVRPGRLPQDVLAHDADVGRAVVHVRRHIGATDENHAQGPGLDQQLTPELLRPEVGESRPLEQLERAAHQGAGRERDRDAQDVPPASRAATCSGGRLRVLRPSADQATSPSRRQNSRFAAPTVCHQRAASAAALGSVSTTARMPKRRSVEPSLRAGSSASAVHAIA